MPRDILILSAEAPDLAAFIHAGASVDPELAVRTLDSDAVIEIIDDDVATLSVGRPEYIDNPAEVARLAPSAAGRFTGPVWWTEAWAPWGVHGEVGVRIALTFAADIGATCIVEDAS